MANQAANLESFRPNLSIDSPPTFPLVALTTVETPDDLRNFFDNGGITELARPLDYILQFGAEEVEDDRFVINGSRPHERFSVAWHERAGQDKRSLIVQSNLGTLTAGLFLGIPVESQSYRLSHGDIIASYARRPGTGHLTEHYLKRGQAPHIGQPEAAVKVHKIAREQLLLACGQIAAAHLSNK